jgi:hypothetical protein
MWVTPRYEVRPCVAEWAVYDGDNPEPVYQGCHDRCDQVAAELEAADGPEYEPVVTLRQHLRSHTPHPAHV